MNQVILKTNATHKDKLQTYRKTFTFTVFGYKILGRDIIHTWIIGHTHLHAALVNTGTIISANLQKQDQLTQLSFCFLKNTNKIQVYTLNKQLTLHMEIQ